MLIFMEDSGVYFTKLHNFKVNGKEFCISHFYKSLSELLTKNINLLKPRDVAIGISDYLFY